MMFGQDFFKVIRFALAIIEMFAKIFGDDDDRTNGENGPEIKIDVKSKQVGH